MSYNGDVDKLINDYEKRKREIEESKKEEYYPEPKNITGVYVKNGKKYKITKDYDDEGRWSGFNCEEMDAKYYAKRTGKDLIWVVGFPLLILSNLPGLIVIAGIIAICVGACSVMRECNSDIRRVNKKYKGSQYNPSIDNNSYSMSKNTYTKNENKQTQNIPWTPTPASDKKVKENLMKRNVTYKNNNNVQPHTDCFDEIIYNKMRKIKGINSREIRYIEKRISNNKTQRKRNFS